MKTKRLGFSAFLETLIIMVVGVTGCADCGADGDTTDEDRMVANVRDCDKVDDDAVKIYVTDEDMIDVNAVSKNTTDIEQMRVQRTTPMPIEFSNLSSEMALDTHLLRFFHPKINGIYSNFSTDRSIENEVRYSQNIIPVTSSYLRFPKDATPSSVFYALEKYYTLSYTPSGSYGEAVGTSQIRHIALWRNDEVPPLLLDNGIYWDIKNIKSAYAHYESPSSEYNDLAFIVWSDKRNGTWDLYSSRVDLGGWANLDVNGQMLFSGEGDNLYPAIAWNKKTNSSSGIWMVWSNNQGINLARIKDDGTLFESSPEILTPSQGSEISIICRNQPDWCIIAWREGTSNTVQVYIIDSDPSSLNIINHYAIDSSQSRNVVALEKGVIFVNSIYDVYYSRFSLSDGQEIERKLIYSVEPFWQDFGAAYLESTDSFLLAWSHGDSPVPQYYGIYGKRFSGDGVPLDTDPIEIAAPNSRFDPVLVATDGATGWNVYWVLLNYQEWSSFPIESRSIMADGSVPNPIDNPSLGASPQERLDASAAGNTIFVSWTQNPPMNRVVLGSLFDSSGICIGSSCNLGEYYIVDEDKVGYYAYPRVATDDTKFLLIWKSDQNGILGEFHRKEHGWIIYPPGTITISDVGSNPNLAWGINEYLIIWATSNGVRGTRLSPEGTILDGSGFDIRAGSAVDSFNEISFDGDYFHILGPGTAYNNVNRDGTVSQTKTLFADGGSITGLDCRDGECLIGSYISGSKKIKLQKINQEGSLIASPLTIPAEQTGYSSFDGLSICSVGDQYFAIWNNLDNGFSRLKMIRIKDYGLGQPLKIMDRNPRYLSVEIGVKTPRCTTTVNGKLVVVYEMWDDPILSFRGRIALIDELALGANGDWCDSDQECKSNVCVEGVCCATECPEDCYSCSLPGNEGTCSAFPDGSICNLDANGCTLDYCQTGFCMAGEAPDCSAQSDQCNTGVCSSTGDNSYVCVKDPTSHVGDTCGDGPTECSGQDTCDGSGVCQANDFDTSTTCGDDGTECVNQDYCDGSGSCHDNGFVAADTACGDASDTECDNPDSCDGSGTCQVNHEPGTTTCGDAGTECVNQDYCDGSGSCTDNGFVASDTSCGDGPTECSGQDTCDGSGVCQANDFDTSTTCGDDGTECINQDYCDGSGSCTDNGFVAADTSCGNGPSECSGQDTCDGSGTCQANDFDTSTTCGDDGTECVNQDYCDGSGSCNDNGFVAADTSCGDGPTECSGQDTCDGLGTCQSNDFDTSTTCGNDGTECVNQDYCDGSGSCTDNGFVAADTSCGDGPTECSGQDTCDGSGVCQANDFDTSTTCGDDGTECINQDYCDGSGSCHDNGFVAADTACGDASDTECDNPDSCDGSGTCQVNHEPGTTTCGDAGTECVNQDYCDGSGSCTDNGFVASDTSCGDGPTECSGQDTCDGSGVCQANDFDTSTTCGDDGTECINQDYCDGSGSCTDNGFVAADTSCGNGPSECSGQDTCDGSGTCQANDFDTSTTCGDDGTECVNQDYCDGSGSCNDNGFVAADTSCGDGPTECSGQDTCDGLGTCQSNDFDTSTTCGNDGTECVNQDYCDGSGSCTDNGFVAADTSCGDGPTECSGQDTCDGSGVCQANDFDTSTTCGDDGTECINQDYCDGSGSCHDNGFVAADTACGDASDTECDNPDSCDGSGTCQVNHEPGTTTCGDAGTECVNQDYCDGSGSCTDNGFVASDTSCGDGPTECSGQDTCDGSGVCQANDFDTSTTCGDDGTECINQDYCDGSGSCTDNGFVAADTSCGNGPSECSGQDTCDGSGTCQANDFDTSTTCGDDGTECVNQDYCDGSGSCNDNGFVAADTTCGDAPTECSGQDTCDGSGTCQLNDFDTSTTCGDAGTECVNQDYCDGSGSCTDYGFTENGTECDDNNPDTHNDQCLDGICLGETCTCAEVNSCCDGCFIINNGESCTSDNLDCTTDICDEGICTHLLGADVCLIDNRCIETGELNSDNDCESCQPAQSTDAWSFVVQDTPCGENTTDCSGQDMCDGLGTCQPNHLAENTPCDDSDRCTYSDQCDGEGFCSGIQHLCEPGICEVASNCDGMGGCEVIYSDNGVFCDAAEEGQERCYDGQCVSINDGEVCDMPIQLQVDSPENFTTDGMINAFTPDVPCSEKALSGPDIFFEVDLQPGSYWITVDPEDTADLAIVLIDSCDPISCTYSLNGAGPGEIESYGPIVVNGDRNETTALFSIDSVSYETAGSFEILVEKEAIVDGDEDLDLEPEQDTEFEDDLDSDDDLDLDDDFDLDDDLDEPTEADINESIPDGDIEEDRDNTIDGDQNDEDADLDDEITPSTSIFGGGGGCHSTENIGVLFLGLLFCFVWIYRREWR